MFLLLGILLIGIWKAYFALVGPALQLAIAAMSICQPIAYWKRPFDNPALLEV